MAGQMPAITGMMTSFQDRPPSCPRCHEKKWNVEKVGPSPAEDMETESEQTSEEDYAEGGDVIERTISTKESF